MVPTSDIVFLGGIDYFGSVVHSVPDSSWSVPSPCEGWSALDVLGHLGSAIDFGVDILEGRDHQWPTFDRPADLVVGEPADYWAGIATSARSALEGADLGATRDTPMGTRTVAQGLAFPAIDLYVHAWDIGRSGRIEVEVPDDVIGFAHHYLDQIPPEKMRGPGGAFGPELTAPPDATPTEAFIAWTGRQPR
ncbi:MAG TPA: TIGR03086 family metal-binding protein [Acidimicrobiales bacterium]